MQSPSLLVTISYYSIPSGMLGGASYIINGVQLTAYSVRCAAVVHAASPLQMGRIQRISLGQRLT